MRIGISIERNVIKSVLCNANGMIVKNISTPASIAELSTKLKENLSKLLLFNRDNLAGIFIGFDHVRHMLKDAENLESIGVLRLSGHKPDILFPGFNWPETIKSKVLAGYETLNGGFEYDGEPITELQETEILNATKCLIANGAKNIIICGTFSVFYKEQELLAKGLIESNFNATVFCSHLFEANDFYERENITMLNAALKKSFSKKIDEITEVINDMNLNCSVYFTQNDNSAVALREIKEFPYKTIDSVSINTVIGASKLTQYKNAFIVDMNETKTRAALIRNGTVIKFKKSNSPFTTNEMVWFHTTKLGLNSQIYVDNDKVTVEPYDYESSIAPIDTLKTALLICNTNTKIRSNLDTHTAYLAVETAEKMLMELYEKMISKDTSKALGYYKFLAMHNVPMPIIFVGSASCLFAAHETIVAPPFSDFASAYGAVMNGLAVTISEIVEVLDNEETANLYQERAFEILEERNAGNLKVTFLNITPYRYIPGKWAHVTIIAKGDFIPRGSYEVQSHEIRSYNFCM